MEPSPERQPVRPLAAADRPAWRELWLAYNRFYDKPVTPEEITEALWSRIIDPAEPVHALAVGPEGAPLGFTHYLYHRNTSFLAPVCYLQDLFTAPEARGQGVARALIEGVCEAARAAGSPRVYWLTHESNATARRLYDQVAERSGFLQYRITL